LGLTALRDQAILPRIDGKGALISDDHPEAA